MYMILFILRLKIIQEAEIDYVFTFTKRIYLVGDLIELETIVQNTKNILLRYVTKINGHEVEDTGFIESKRLRVKPKCSGKYTFEIYAKILYAMKIMILKRKYHFMFMKLPS